MSDKKVAIIGYGYLGKAFERFFKDHYETIWYDPFVQGSATKEEINECDLAVIAVPTNPKEDGSCDTSIVEESVSWLKTPLILIKSAVSPLTTHRLHTQKISSVSKGDGFIGICVSPEYMGESTYFTPYWKYPHPTDGKMHDFFVIGGEEPAATMITDYVLKVVGPDAKIIKMTSTEAEIVKYMENSWGATKVTFSNEFYEICKAFGADYQKVREGFLADSRVERMHTMVLPDKRGFGGKCFPKDVLAITRAVEKAPFPYEAKLLKQVLRSNADFVESRIEHKRCEKCGIAIPSDFVNDLCYEHYDELVNV